MEVMTWKMFDEACRFLTVKLQTFNPDSIYGIPRGGMVVAVRLSHLTGLPVVPKPDKKTLVVDDICDSGITLKKFDDKNYITATLYFNENAVCKPTIWALKKTQFVVFPWETNGSAKIDYEVK